MLKLFALYLLLVVVRSQHVFVNQCDSQCNYESQIGFVYSKDIKDISPGPKGQKGEPATQDGESACGCSAEVNQLLMQVNHFTTAHHLKANII